MGAVVDADDERLCLELEVPLVWPEEVQILVVECIGVVNIFPHLLPLGTQVHQPHLLLQPLLLILHLLQIHFIAINLHPSEHDLKLVTIIISHIDNEDVKIVRVVGELVIDYLAVGF